MEQLILKAAPRQLLGKKVKTLRGKGQIPAILYGRNFQSLPLALDKGELAKISEQAGESTLIDLEAPGQKPMKVLIRHIQNDPVSDNPLHVDLYKVDMEQEIETEIPLEFVGTSAAVEELEGNLITNKNSIEVECLPDKLVSKIEVDISPLKTFEDLILVKNLKIPAGIKVLEEIDDVVAQVTPPRSEEELEAMKTETAAEAEKAQIETMEAQAESEKAKVTEAEGKTETGAEEKTTQETEGKEKKDNK